jgi:hypothetical protein
MTNSQLGRLVPGAGTARIRALKARRCPMSKESPADDPRQKIDGGSLKQTDKPWKGPPEMEQKPIDDAPDLEQRQETQTH